MANIREISSPLYKKLDDEIVKILFQTIANNVTFTDNANKGKSVQEVVLSLQAIVNNLLTGEADLTKIDTLADLLKLISENKNTITQILKDKLSTSDVVDNLFIGGRNKALSAEQGVELKKQINEIRDTAAAAYYTDLDPNSTEFKAFIINLPDGALVSIPADKELDLSIEYTRDLISTNEIKDIEGFSLYHYNYDPIEIDTENVKVSDITSFSLYDYINDEWTYQK